MLFKVLPSPDLKDPRKTLTIDSTLSKRSIGDLRLTWATIAFADSEGKIGCS